MCNLKEHLMCVCSHAGGECLSKAGFSCHLKTPGNTEAESEGHSGAYQTQDTVRDISEVLCLQLPVDVSLLSLPTPGSTAGRGSKTASLVYS